MEKRVFFISGHRDITEAEFNKYYLTALFRAIDNYDAYFVVGDYYGVDIMAQNYLVNVLKINPEHITVYHMFEKPRNLNSKITNLKGGYKDDIERDSAMTNESDEDIAFIRKGKEASGTAQNILRRYTF